MGVHGLWRLLDASGKPVPLETLEGKVLAIDVSIWIHQVLQGYQDRKGSTIPNAHLIGLFHRICKLLYFKIKPVFVFDGGVPMLKKNTIASRRKLKAISAGKAQQLKNDLIQNLIKHTAVKSVLSLGNVEKSAGSSQESFNSVKSATEDMFKLPSMPSGSQSEDPIDDYEDYESDSSIELSPRKQSRWIGNIHNVDVNSADFKALPADVRYDVLTDLKETRKQNSWGRLHEMPHESHEFSSFQMKRLLKRQQVQESLETAEKEMGGKTLTLEELEKLLTEQGIETGGNDTKFRIAADSATRLIYISDPKSLQSASTNDKTIEKPSQSSELQVSQDSGHDESSFVTTNTESVIENINEYDLDSDWDSDNDVMLVPAKNVEPSPINMKKFFGKPGINPAIAYMLEYAGLPQDQILALIEENKKKPFSKNKSELKEKNVKKATDESQLLPESLDEKLTKDDELIEKSGSSKSISAFDELMEMSRVKDTTPVSKSSSEIESIEQPRPKINDSEDSVPAVESMSSDSDTGDDLVEIQDVPIPEMNFGLEIVVKSDEVLKEEDDIFADVFAETSANTSVLSTQNLSNTLESLKSASSEDLIEEPTSNKNDLPVPVPNSQESVIEPDFLAESKTNESAVAEIDDEVPADSLPEPSTSKADELSEEVARFKPELLKADQEKLATMQAELENEHSDLTEHIGKLERQATAITDQMRLEAQDLLRLFGIPYVVAPMEAEAQCAYLENISLTDGTVTDDSDIWLFGGRCVYKNFFNNNKRVLQYKSSDIQHHFKLSRQQMIQLALLVGSDYTVGVTGIGPVTALEILAAFPSEGDNLLNGLSNFCSWIRTGRSTGPGRTSLRNKLRNVEIERGFPSQAVVQAYLFPTVDESKEPFSWSKPNLTLLADYTRQKFGWTRTKFEEIINPVVKKLAETKSQKDIMSYFQVKTIPKSIETNLSKRVKRAVQRLGHDALAEDVNEEDDAEVDKTSTQKKEPPQRRGKASKNQAVQSEVLTDDVEGEKETKKVDGKAVGSEVLGLNESDEPKGSTAGTSGQRNGKNVEEYIPQREKDKANALKKKLRAIEVFRKSKKGPGRMKKAKRSTTSVKKVVDLSESSDSS